MRRNDSGAGVVLVLIAVVVLMAALSIVALFVQVWTVRSELDAAADLSALRAAAETNDPAAACYAATEVAAANAVSVDRCEVFGAVATVVVSQPAPPALARLAAALGFPPLRLHSISRAGPPGSAGQVADHQIQQRQSVGLSQRFIAVAALRRLDARWAARQTFTSSEHISGCCEPNRGGLVTAFGKTRASGGTVVNNDRGPPRIRMDFG